MAKSKFTVLDLIDLDFKEHNSLNLISIGDRKGLSREIVNSELNRPGLALSGFFDSFAYQRIQIFGCGEYAYLEKLIREEKLESIQQLFSYSIPCCIFTHTLTPNSDFMATAEKARCPILQTDLSTAEFSARLIRILSNIFSPRKGIHGVLMEVYGLGVLIVGESGVGKSEAALELIKHGHRLVADDMVDIQCINGNLLLGAGANKIIGHHMEIRGLGIINITHLFGIGSVRDQKQVQLVIQLEEEKPDKTYDRLGIERKYMELLGVSVPKIEIAVKPGRNVPVIVETAAMNERLRRMGYDAAKEFNQNIMKWQEMSYSDQFVFFGEDII
ncbi:MAG: HPr(Ser) kinase/phosphatase [Treponema sp.]|jgi:HPr kinase/phosphorylase|nr:HPr(Ser) kinase/phosphatase [Treponema sp.]